MCQSISPLVLENGENVNGCKDGKSECHDYASSS